MKIKDKPRIITIIVTIAVAGIIASQLLWLNMAYELNTERERHRTSLLLQKTADQLIALQSDKIPDTLTENSTNQYIQKLLTADLIDSLITENMANLEIKKDYRFAIINKKTRDIIVSNTKNISRQGNSVYKASLSCIKNPTPFTLYLNIEAENSTILNRIKIWLLISLILLIIIFSAFIRTVNFLRKEKKITREKMDFVKNMIHEYKTPLATINMATDMLLNDNNNTQNKQLIRYLNIIKQENTRLRQLVEKLMGMTIIDRTELDLSKEEIDIRDVINQAVQSLTLQIEQLKAKIHTNFSATQHLLYVDSIHITHVMANILENSLKYAQKPPEITINTFDDPQYLIRIDICDNGPGIPLDEQKHIFKQFFRGQYPKKEEKQGFGLGLYYVKKIIEQHNGKIEIKESSEQGTCLSVYLSEK
ncbi:MAG: sensor histidine kinase [Bacteroidales bacterium]